MDRTFMSRTLTPAHYGETVESHPRTYALLRAWAIQRSRQDGWADRRPGRGRVLAKEEDELVDQVVGIGATIGLLGCARADALFELRAPSIVTRVRPRMGAMQVESATGVPQV